MNDVSWRSRPLNAEWGALLESGGQLERHSTRSRSRTLARSSTLARPRPTMLSRRGLSEACTEMDEAHAHVMCARVCRPCVRVRSLLDGQL
eukprot:4783095-Prymnesium_polylepis.1